MKWNLKCWIGLENCKSDKAYLENRPHRHEHGLAAGFFLH